MLRTTFLISLLPLLFAACAPVQKTAITVTPQPTLEGVSIVAPAKAISDTNLVNSAGEALNFSDLRGKPTIVAFGYTHCPDVCPILLANYRRLKAEMGEQADAVQYVFISVDGARDTPAALGNYVSKFDPTFIGLTCDDATARSTIQQFNGTYTLNNAEGLKTENYTVDHTALSFLLDAEGNWIRTYAYDLDPTIIAQDIRRVLGG